MKARLINPLKRGFSLLEVLVAMSILSIIVMIMSGIFQQTNLAWSVSLKSSSDQSNVRSAIGIVTRDLSMIVDPSYASIHYALGDNNSTFDPPEFTNNNLTFYITRPISAITAKDKATRELVKVEYSGGSTLTRKESTYKNGSFGSTTTASFEFGSGNVSFKVFDDSSSDTGANATPYAVTVTVKPNTPPSISDYDIGVASAGPDGKWDTDDDISTWPAGDQ